MAIALFGQCSTLCSPRRQEKLSWHHVSKSMMRSDAPACKQPQHIIGKSFDIPVRNLFYFERIGETAGMWCALLKILTSTLRVCFQVVWSRRSPCISAAARPMDMTNAHWNRYGNRHEDSLPLSNYGQCNRQNHRTNALLPAALTRFSRAPMQPASVFIFILIS